MSAIAGFLQRDGAPADPEIIRRMVVRIAHRGPNGSGARVDGPAALGHLLLQIAPESIGERQPLESSGGGLLIAFDGRIDNREDLWESMNIPSSEWTRPDAALVLRAYEKWGGDCPVYLVGEFTFAIWNRRRQTLFCARDVFGSRNFFYHLSPGRFVFSSEINGILAAPEVPRHLDELALGCRLAGIPVHCARTLYEGIVQLPPAHSLTLRPGYEPCLRRYWRLELEPEIRLGSPKAYAEALRELLSKAVRARLRTNHPVAAMLSGGLDSSGIVCLAARELAARGQRLVTVSGILPNDFTGNERVRGEFDFIRSVLDQEPNIDPLWARGNAFPIIDFDDALLWRLGEPLNDNFAFRTRELIALAEARGVRVILGGLGGDMAASFTGAGWLEQLLRQGRLVELVRQIRLQSGARQIPPYRVLKSEILRPLSPLWYRRWRMDRQPDNRHGWHGMAVHPDFAARLNLEELRHEIDPDDQPLDIRRSNPRLLAQDRTLYGSAWVSNNSNAVEGPQPLMDRRIWEFAHRTPLDQFCLNGMPRSLYRQALADVLPEPILRRTTKGWFAPDYRQRLGAQRSSIRNFMDAHPISNEIWSYIHRPTIEVMLQELNRPAIPNQWDVSYQLILGQGLRLAHFLSWFHRKSKNE